MRDLDGAVDGAAAAILALIGAILTLTALALRWALRRVAYSGAILTGAGVYAAALLVTRSHSAAGGTVLAGAAWLTGAPALEDRRRRDGKPVPRTLTATAWAARAVTHTFGAIHVRIAWWQACKTAGLAPVRVRRVQRTPAGWRLAVTFTAGQHSGHVDRVSANLASSLRARAVRVFSHAEDQRRGTIIIATGADPLATETGPWPLQNTPRLSLWSPIPIGADENGRAVAISLPEQNLLVGGIPGVGKSNLASMIVAAGALDHSCRLFLIDGKGGLEFHAWNQSAALVGTNVPEAIAILEALQALMDARVSDLKARGRRKVSEGDGLPLILLAIDELELRDHAQDSDRAIGRRCGVDGKTVAKVRRELGIDRAA